MKKKFAAILCTFVLLLACLCLPAFAAGKPNVELSTLQVVWGLIVQRVQQSIVGIIHRKRLNIWSGM